jgi:pilus assembly protein CpaC
VYSVEVTADAPGLERFLRSLMPEEDIRISASGNAVTLSGTVKDPTSIDRAVEVAKSTGATIIDNLVGPPAVQVLVKVRFAEINRSALRDWSTWLRVLNPHEISDNGNWFGVTDPSASVQTIGFLLDSGNEEIEALVQAAVAKGDLRTLAEPNLLTLPGERGLLPRRWRVSLPDHPGRGQQRGLDRLQGIRDPAPVHPNIARNGAIRSDRPR